MSAYKIAVLCVNLYNLSALLIIHNISLDKSNTFVYYENKSEAHRNTAETRVPYRTAMETGERKAQKREKPRKNAALVI